MKGTYLDRKGGASGYGCELGRRHVATGAAGQQSRRYALRVENNWLLGRYLADGGLQLLRRGLINRFWPRDVLPPYDYRSNIAVGGDVCREKGDSRKERGAAEE